MKDLSEMIASVRSARPLVHCITNYVTVNDCANMLLAAGGSPIMADDEREAAEITSICGALCINIGTLNAATIPAMFAAGRRASELGRAAVLDPVGVGASALRTETALSLLREVRFTIVRGNMSEIKCLATGTGAARGVDSAESVDDCSLDSAVRLAHEFAESIGAVVAITGAIDVVADASSAYVIRNGSPLMGLITGAGCQLSVLCAAFDAASGGDHLRAAACAVATMGICGETARRRMTDADGNASFRSYMIDAMYNMTPETFVREARYEQRTRVS